jgi:lysophospholipase L1-like esterase
VEAVQRRHRLLYHWAMPSGAQTGASASRGTARKALFRSVLLLLLFAVSELGALAVEATSERLPGPFARREIEEYLLNPNQPMEHLGIVDRLNADAYRGSLQPPEPGVHRVVVLGDSMTFGFGVSALEAWPAEVARSLLGPGTGARRVQLLNFAVPGYDTRLALEAWRRRAASQRPDHVLLAWYGNDGIADRHGPWAFRHCPDPVPAGERVLSALVDRLALVRVAVDLVSLATARHPWLSYGHSDPAVPGSLAMRCSLRWMEDLRAEVEQSGAGFSVVLLPFIPDLSDVGRHEVAGQLRAAEAMEARGLTVVPLAAELAEVDLEGAVLPDTHPSPQGHQLIAAAVARHPELLGLPPLPDGAPMGVGNRATRSYTPAQ